MKAWLGPGRDGRPGGSPTPAPGGVTLLPRPTGHTPHRTGLGCSHSWLRRQTEAGDDLSPCRDTVTCPHSGSQGPGAFPAWLTCLLHMGPGVRTPKGDASSRSFRLAQWVSRQLEWWSERRLPARSWPTCASSPGSSRARRPSSPTPSTTGSTSTSSSTSATTPSPSPPWAGPTRPTGMASACWVSWACPRTCQAPRAFARLLLMRPPAWVALSRLVSCSCLPYGDQCGRGLGRRDSS